MEDVIKKLNINLFITVLTLKVVKNSIIILTDLKIINKNNLK